MTISNRNYGLTVGGEADMSTEISSGTSSQDLDSSKNKAKKMKVSPSQRHDIFVWLGGLAFIALLAGAIFGIGDWRGWDAASGYTHNTSATSAVRFWSEPMAPEVGVRGRYGVDATGRWYYWKLPPTKVTTLTRTIMWLCYVLHNLLYWLGLYKLQASKMEQRQTGKSVNVYSCKLGGWNWYLFAINILFHLVHLGQTHWTYDALAQDVSISSSQSSVIMLLIFIMVLEYRDRGLFFGWPSQFDKGKWSRKLTLPYAPMYLVRKLLEFLLGMGSIANPMKILIGIALDIHHNGKPGNQRYRDKLKIVYQVDGTEFVHLWEKAKDSLNTQGRELERHFDVGEYHGYAFAWAAIYTFWYHPMENTWGHVMGFFHTYVLLLQGCLAYTPFHLNKYWRFFLEVWVTAHGGVVAAQTGGTEMMGTKLWPMFVFGFLLLVVLSQLFGLPFWRKIPGWVRIFPLIVYLAVVIYMYSWIPDATGAPWVRIQEVIRIPGVYYLYFFLVWFWTLLLLTLRRCDKSKNDDELSLEEITMATKFMCLGGIILIYAIFVAISATIQVVDVQFNMIALMIILTGLFALGCCVTNILFQIIFRQPEIHTSTNQVSVIDIKNVEKPEFSNSQL